MKMIVVLFLKICVVNTTSIVQKTLLLFRRTNHVYIPISLELCEFEML